MKVKLGNDREWTIYAVGETKECVMDIHFPKKLTKKKIKEIQKTLQETLAEINI